MKTQHNKLDFSKQTISELNDKELTDVSGGSSHVCALIGSIGISLAITFNMR